MKRSTAITLLLFGMTLPACAQHGGVHGGFSSHSGSASGGMARSGPAFSGGSRSFASPRPASPAPRFTGSRPGPAPNAGVAMRRGAAVHYGARPLNYGAQENSGAQGERRSPYRSPYRHPDRGGIIYETPYAAGAPLYFGYPYGLGYFGDYGFGDDYDASSDSGAAPYYGPDQYSGFDPGGQSQTQVWPQEDPNGGQGMPQLNPDEPYRPYYGAPHPVSNLTAQPVVTLVFKDHRPNQQIRNYLINGDTLTVWDQHPHEISLDQLDMDATEKINHDAGVDLYLPGAPK